MSVDTSQTSQHLRDQRLNLRNISSHPNLQIDITCHSGRMGLSGREIDKTGFGLCHSGFWTFLDVFVSRLLQICAGFGLVSDDQIFWRAHQIC